MRWSIFLILAGLCLSFRLPEQPDVLQQLVTLNYQGASLQEILRDLRDQYQVKFAYLNNEVPEDRTFSIQAEQRSLKQVLDELLEGTHLSYRVVNGQIVLKKETDALPVAPPPPAHRGGNRSTFPPKDSSLQEEAPVPPPRVKHRNTFRVPPVVAPLMVRPPEYVSLPLTGTTDSLRQEYVHPVALVGSVEEDPRFTEEADTLTIPPPVLSAGKPIRESSKRSERITRNVQQVMNKLLPDPHRDSSDYLYRPFHLGVIYPLSTNGTRAGQIVNKFSAQLLVGYSAGLDGAEFSGIGTIENDYVEGAQFAGFFNLVRHDVKGIQSAGFVNASGGDVRGAQLSGFLNVSAGNVNGLQGTGFVNVATGAQHGAQLSGFVNLLTDSIRGLQGTGFVNVATGGVRGGQVSGFVNYTHHLKGVQASGFINVASGDVQGAQIAGFINYAHHVKGAQIGLLNVADSIDGVPIGLMSIVRKNGYRRLELWYDQVLQANVAFKMGVPQFYNMLVLGTQFADSNVRWGVGYGAGTLFPLTSRVDMNLDLFAMQIHEDSDQFFKDYPLNLLSTLRFSVNLHLAEHLTLFAAPTLNVMVSRYRQPDNGIVGSRLAPSNTFYDETFEHSTRTQVNGQTYPAATNVKIWPGLHAGVRF